MVCPQEALTDALNAVKWNCDGLVPAIAQEITTNEILMMAWMNREALQRTLETQTGVYWSRSRQRLWHKGEESGHTQIVQEVRLDCDADAILLKVQQRGGIACHTGRKSCFYRIFADSQWKQDKDVLKQPQQIYSQKKEK